MIELDNSCDIPVPPLSQSSPSPLLSFEKYENEISYSKFFSINLEGNKPCLFGSWLTKSWPITNEWVNEDGQPNCQLLSQLFGGAEVPVANCDRKDFNSQEKETFIFKDYLDYFRNKLYGQKKKCLYLKDWHFVKAFPSYVAYTVPSFFASDWLNEFWAHRTNPTDDYRFVYVGPKGSWTPFHADVFRSFSWSANICGKKRWIFYPPQEGIFLQDKFGELIYDVESPELRNTSLYPKSCLATGRIEIIQEKGETIFVPSNWYHQVSNLEDTISVNHNWINGSNIRFVLEFFLSSLKKIEEAINDCRGMDEWESQCQLILKSIHGMDAKEFYCFLRTIAIRRIKYLRGDITLSSFPEWKFGRNHVIHDARRLIWCLEKFLEELSPELKCVLEGEEEDPSLIIDQLQDLI